MKTSFKMKTSQGLNRYILIDFRGRNCNNGEKAYK